MSRNKHRSRLLAEAKAKGLCRPPPKPGGAERHRQHQINTHAKYVRRAWLQVVRDDKVSYRQRMDAQLAHREAEHQSAIANLRCQLASAQIAAERNAEDAARSAAEAADIAKQAAQAAQQTQIRHTEYRQALYSAISSVTDHAASALAKEKTTVRSLDEHLSKRAPVSRQLLTSAEKMRNADRKWNRAVYYY